MSILPGRDDIQRHGGSLAGTANFLRRNQEAKEAISETLLEHAAFAFTSPLAFPSPHECNGFAASVNQDVRAKWYPDILFETGRVSAIPE